VILSVSKMAALTEDSMPWLWQLVTGLSPQRLSFNPRLYCARFVVDEVATVQVFLRVLQFSPSVPFCGCSTLIHLSLADAVYL
jgi:hypothetical protein